MSSIIGRSGSAPRAASAKRALEGVEGLRRRGGSCRVCSGAGAPARRSGRAAKARQPVEREVDLHDRAAHVDRAQRRARTSAGSAALADELRGTCAADPRSRARSARLERAAVLEHDAARAPALARDARDRRVAPDLGAGVARRARERVGEARPCRRRRRPRRRARRSSRPSRGGAARSRCRATRARRRRRSARRSRASPRSGSLSNQDSSAGARRAEQQRQQGAAARAGTPRAARSARSSGGRSRALEPRRVGRRHVERAPRRRAPPGRGAPRSAGSASASRAEKRADRVAARAAVGAEQEAAPVRQRRERGGRPARDQPQPARGEPELAHHRGTQQAGDVGRPRDPVARPELLA